MRAGKPSGPWRGARAPCETARAATRLPEAMALEGNARRCNLVPRNELGYVDCATIPPAAGGGSGFTSEDRVFEREQPGHVRRASVHSQSIPPPARRGPAAARDGARDGAPLRRVDLAG